MRYTNSAKTMKKLADVSMRSRAVGIQKLGRSIIETSCISFLSDGHDETGTDFISIEKCRSSRSYLHGKNIRYRIWSMVFGAGQA